MPDRCFMECRSLDFDDAGFVEGFNLESRIWVAFQLRFSGLTTATAPSNRISTSASTSSGGLHERHFGRSHDDVPDER